MFDFSGQFNDKLLNLCVNGEITVKEAFKELEEFDEKHSSPFLIRENRNKNFLDKLYILRLENFINNNLLEKNASEMKDIFIYLEKLKYYSEMQYTPEKTIMISLAGSNGLELYQEKYGDENSLLMQNKEFETTELLYDKYKEILNEEEVKKDEVLGFLDRIKTSIEETLKIKSIEQNRKIRIETQQKEEELKRQKEEEQKKERQRKKGEQKRRRRENIERKKREQEELKNKRLAQNLLERKKRLIRDEQEKISCVVTNQFLFTKPESEEVESFLAKNPSMRSRYTTNNYKEVITVMGDKGICPKQKFEEILEKKEEEIKERKRVKRTPQKRRGITEESFPLPSDQTPEEDRGMRIPNIGEIDYEKITTYIAAKADEDWGIVIAENADMLPLGNYEIIKQKLSEGLQIIPRDSKGQVGVKILGDDAAFIKIPGNQVLRVECRKLKGDQFYTIIDIFENHKDYERRLIQIESEQQSNKYKTTYLNNKRPVRGRRR